MSINIFNFNFNIYIKRIKKTINKKVRKNERNNILVTKTKNVYSLINHLKNEKSNNISADLISFSYDNSTPNSFNISIEIEGIRNKINTYYVCILGNGETTEVTLKLENSTIKPIKSSGNKYTLYSFKLYNNDIERLEICIQGSIKNINHPTNLYFIPRNYLKNVDLIKINSNNKQLKYYRANDNGGYEDVVTIEPDDEPITFNVLNDRNYVNSVFFVPDFISE